MNCKNCNKELTQIEGKKTRFFCDNNGRCRMAYNRRLLKSEQTKSEQTEIKCEQANTNTINRWGENVKEMDAKTLYAFIRAYPSDTWKDSPDFAELQRRLKTKKVEDLKKEGYWIPSWKDPVRV